MDQNIEKGVFILGVTSNVGAAEIQNNNDNTQQLFINFDKYITNKIVKIIFSLLSKQTYSIYLFHFAIIYLIKANNLLLNTQSLFVIYLISLFIFSTLFYYLFEKIIIENRPNYTSKIINT